MQKVEVDRISATYDMTPAGFIVGYMIHHNTFHNYGHINSPTSVFPFSFLELIWLRKPHAGIGGLEKDSWTRKGENRRMKERRRGKRTRTKNERKIIQRIRQQGNLDPVLVGLISYMFQTSEPLSEAELFDTLLQQCGIVCPSTVADTALSLETLKYRLESFVYNHSFHFDPVLPIRICDSTSPTTTYDAF